MNDKNAKKPLLIVVTRAYAPKNSTDDEFVHEWGFSEDRGYEEFLDDNKMAFVVVHGLHGHTGRYGEVVKKALGECKVNKDMIDKVYFFHHSMEDTDKTNVEKVLTAFFDVPTSNTLVYHSEGGAAVDGLIRVLKDGKYSNKTEGFVPNIEAAATGRRLFCARFYEIRDGLLSLLLAFQAKEDSEVLRDADGLSRILEDLKAEGRWKQWHAELNKFKHSRHEIGSALKTLEVWRKALTSPPDIKSLENSPDHDEGETPNDQETEFFKRWSMAPTESDWATERWEQEDATKIRSDIRRLAKEIDLLIDALDGLPPTPEK